MRSLLSFVLLTTAIGAVPLTPAVAQDATAIRIQILLKQAGCLAGEADGKWGPKSRNALQRFSEAGEIDFGGSEPRTGVLLLMMETPDVRCEAIQEVKQGGAVAQNSGQPAPVEVTLGEPTEKGVEAAPAAPQAAGCLIATLSVGEKPGYKIWDWPKPDPDTAFSERTTGASNYCEDSYSCSVRIQPVGSTLSFFAEDRDASNHDRIGEGICDTAPGTCSIPPAGTVTLRGC